MKHGIALFMVSHISPGHCVPALTIEASTFVRVDGIRACRKGDHIASHITPPCSLPGPPHSPQIATEDGRFTRFDGLLAAAGRDPVSGCTPIDYTSVSTFMRTS